MRKKLVLVNTVTNNSTGRIMHDIQSRAIKEEYDTLAIVGRRKIFNDVPCIKIGNLFSFWIHVIITTLYDRHGFGSKYHTKKIIKQLKMVSPNIINLHNIHGYYLNYPILFKYLSEEYDGKVVWTLHDCWPITGHCAYYTYIGCDKWKTQCYKCANRRQYPISLLWDNSQKNYTEKKRIFSGYENMTIVVPSLWMKKQVQQSFLGNKDIRVISNGIDLNKFDYNRFLDARNLIIRRYGWNNNVKIILGVANIWEERKGLSVFLSLASQLRNNYVIVLVGLTSKQNNKLPVNIIGLSRTENLDELIKLYSAADVFLNPSEEETFSMVTIESMACGTPVIALDNSAVKELISKENGIVLHKPIVEDYLRAIDCIIDSKHSRRMVRDSVMKYSVEAMSQEYMNIFEE